MSMSVTFSPEHVGTGRFLIFRHDDHGDRVVFASFDNYADAESNYLAACAAEGVDTWEAFIGAESAIENAPTVNMANNNAASVLLALDLPHENMYGSENGLAFLERVMTAIQADRLDDALPSFEDGGNGSARMIHVGRAAGYVGDRLAELAEVAIFAKDHGLAVQWG